MSEALYLELLRRVPRSARRDRRILALLAAGFSQREVTDLRRRDIAATGTGRLVIAGKKGGCCRTYTFLTPELSETLDEAMDGLAPDDPVAGISQPAVSRRLQRWKAELDGSGR